jgi:pimeloyl-ACP methyl ester carboxylesterase
MPSPHVSRRIFLGHAIAAGSTLALGQSISAAPSPHSRGARSGPQPTLILIPGLGADGRIFDPQRVLPWPILIVQWIDPKSRESMAGYAARLAATLTVAPPYFLCGMSLGGMLALEMARHLQPEAVILISSARSSAGIRPLYRLAGRGLAAVPLWGELPRCASDPLARFFARYALPSHNNLTPEQTDLCVEVSTSCSPRFVRWACRAVTTWPGLERIDVPVYHIHGELDRMIPLKRVHPDYVVRSGGHLINITHADEVNRYLREKIEAQLRARRDE